MAVKKILSRRTYFEGCDTHALTAQPTLNLSSIYWLADC
jgi:hypothetical protein